MQNFADLAVTHRDSLYFTVHAELTFLLVAKTKIKSIVKAFEIQNIRLLNMQGSEVTANTSLYLDK